jgi:hypothetical protein
MRARRCNQAIRPSVRSGAVCSCLREHAYLCTSVFALSRARRACGPLWVQVVCVCERELLSLSPRSHQQIISIPPYPHLTPSTAPLPSACDLLVMVKATRRGRPRCMQQADHHELFRFDVTARNARLRCMLLRQPAMPPMRASAGAQPTLRVTDAPPSRRPPILRRLRQRPPRVPSGRRGLDRPLRPP